MKRVLIIARNDESQAGLRKKFSGSGLSCFVTSLNNGLREVVANTRPDVLLFEAEGSATPEPIKKLKNAANLPLIALVPEEVLAKAELALDADDFLTAPYDEKELMMRVNRVVGEAAKKENGEQIKCDGLTIDLATCEVSIDGKLVELTFKEYELLKLLAGNKGRVFTREALLDKLWGYDYYGGDRTVDVHIRRLRSKIEDADHIYIETVRNIGYRFVKNA
jgi:DNA-binding response OmpR family regulator